MNCLIVEDEPLAAELLVDFIASVPYLTLAHSCSDSLDALDLLGKEEIDLLFLDINLPKLNGLSLLKSLKQPPFVIFTTAYQEYALEGYELNVVDYLLKPIAYERFIKAVQKARAIHGRAEEVMLDKEQEQLEVSPLFVKEGSTIHQLHLNEVLFIEGLKDYVRIHTTSRRIVSYQRMKSLENELSEQGFRRIHQSYIASLIKIERIEGNQLWIGDRALPISQKYKESLMQALRLLGSAG